MSRAPDANIPAETQSLAAMLADVHWWIHQIRDKPLMGLKQKLSGNIQRAGQLDLDDRDRLLSRLADLPDDDRLCHGDFHPGNIMGSIGSPFVVDWLDATSGPAEADACRTYLLTLHHAPQLASPYLSAYSNASGYPAKQILLWLPVIAAARLSEGVPDETSRLLALARAND
jgi:Ser/Thr protein kinase RdoA (MazF antagonist)